MQIRFRAFTLAAALLVTAAAGAQQIKTTPQRNGGYDRRVRKKNHNTSQRPAHKTAPLRLMQLVGVHGLLGGVSSPTSASFK